MKKLILSLALLVMFGIQNFAITYYVSFSRGNDASPGTSQDSPWKTLDKVNQGKYIPGDLILFKRGDTWRGQLKPASGDSTGFVTYSCYGDKKLPKPLFLGSVSWNDQVSWVNTGGNIWTTVTVKTPDGASVNPLSVDVGNIIFNGGEKCGIKVWNEKSLDAGGKFWYDAENDLVKLYSEGNPAKVFKSIELALKRHIIDEGNKHHVRYDNLDLRYGAAHGIGGGNVHHIIIFNCDISFIGGALQLTREDGKPVRYGNGIEFWDNAHDCYIINNRIGDIYDAALTNQGGNKVAQYNIYYLNNIVWNSEYSFEYWLGNDSKTSHIYFENNTCVNAGSGWGHDQRPDGHNGRHLMFYSNRAKVDNFYIRNNIFSESTESAWRLWTQWTDLDKLIVDHNLYFESTGNLTGWQSINHSNQEFEKYRRDSGKDASSVFADPRFVSVLKLDFRLSSDSPAIDKGTDTGNLKNSIREVVRTGAAWDIGAIEYSDEQK